ncbi:putative uncharacterized protein [Cucumis melo var. makuwa]|uniref:Uncharacterized protein n=1 Tax=Cucumis melo var. makuwa TaxID=1194695 RepID=A0A5D3DEL6_CUCMM|nr:putative uncharacterized protein [Cucumis melo var. makuwa]
MVTVAETGVRIVGYLLNQSSEKPSTTGEAKLRRQQSFFVASFWRLASQVGGLPFLYNYLSPRGHRRRTMSGTGPSVVTPFQSWFFLDMEIDPEIEIHILK